MIIATCIDELMRDVKVATKKGTVAFGSGLHGWGSNVGMELIMKAVGKVGFTGVCKVGMDVAALEFKVDGKDCYDLGTRYAEAGRSQTSR